MVLKFYGFHKFEHKFEWHLTHTFLMQNFKCFLISSLKTVVKLENRLKMVLVKRLTPAGVLLSSLSSWQITLFGILHATAIIIKTHKAGFALLMLILEF